MFDEYIRGFVHWILSFITGPYWWIGAAYMSAAIALCLGLLVDAASSWSNRTFWVRKHHAAPRKMMRYGTCECKVPECIHVKNSRRL